MTMTSRNADNAGSTPVTTGVLNRRDVLGGAGSALAWAAVASLMGAALPRAARAGTQSTEAHALTILYPGGPQARFDANYYRDHHLKLFMQLYGDAVTRFELRTVAATRSAASGADQPGQPASAGFTAMINIWLADMDKFNARGTAAAMKQMGDDKPNYTNTQSSVQIDTVRAEFGEGRSRMNVGDRCVSVLYTNSAAARWDADYYATKHAPLIMSLYGRKALKRLEIRSGASELEGGKPGYLGGANLYIHDQSAFDAAQAEHEKALAADVAHFTSATPIFLTTTLHGVAGGAGQ